jgi:sulfide:quinone oxidoreductase
MTAAKAIHRRPEGGAVRERKPHAAHPAGGAERRAAPAATFSSVLCGVDRRVDSRAAHRQAVLLASPGAAVEVVPTSRLTRHGGRALPEACEGHDLLALAAGADVAAVLEHALIPVLIGRWRPSGTAVTDTILVPVDGTPASGRAVELAARLAAAHGGTVTVLVAPHRDPALQRAIAASRRSVLQATGAVPTVRGEQLPCERAIPAAAIETNASLVVLGTGDTKQARWTAAQIAGRIGASVLAVPPPSPPTAPDPPGAERDGHAATGTHCNGHVRPRGRSRPRVLIAGAGVAGLETLLALRALAADRVDVTLLAPETKFVNRSMCAEQPSRAQRVRALGLQHAAAELDADWHHGALDRVEHDRRRVVTKDGQALEYDLLVLAVGARPVREWRADGVLTYHDGRDGPDYRLLLHRLREGRVDRLAFVKPAGPSWPLPLYDLALTTAADCVANERSDVELSLVTPEAEPLGIFGHRASAAIRRLLVGSGVRLHASSYGVPRQPGWLDISPGEQRLRVDRIVTTPRLAGPRLRGIPSARDGFVHTDAHGRLAGLDGVFAAGDATAFPIKQGGLAAQQADAVAETIAASVGAAIDPRPFRPILRGVLLTGRPARYLRADISGGAGDDSTISAEALWWPPDKIAGRYLAPYLSSQVGDAADVMPTDEHAIPAGNAFDAAAGDTQRPVAELSDLPQR